jgi:hypothetical protein
VATSTYMSTGVTATIKSSAHSVTTTSATPTLLMELIRMKVRIGLMIEIGLVNRISKLIPIHT